MDDKKLFDIFKRNISGMDEMPDESVWAKIESRLEQKTQNQLTLKKRRVVWMSYAVAITLILLVPTFVILYLIDQQNSTDLIAKNEKPVVVETLTETKTINKANTKIIDETKSETLDINKKEEKNIAKEKSVPKIDDNIKPLTDRKKQDVDTTKNKIKKQITELKKNNFNKELIQKSLTASKNENKVKKQNDLELVSKFGKGEDQAMETDKKVVLSRITDYKKERSEAHTEIKTHLAYDESNESKISHETDNNSLTDQKDIHPSEVFTIVNGKKVFAENWQLVGVLPTKNAKNAIPARLLNSFFNNGFVQQNNSINQYHVNEQNEVTLEDTEHTEQQVYHLEDFDLWKTELEENCDTIRITNHRFTIVPPHQQATVFANAETQQKPQHIMIHNFTIECYTNGKHSKTFDTGYIFEQIK